MIGVADRCATWIASVSNTQILEFKADSIHSIGDREEIAVLSIASSGRQVAIEYVYSGVVEQPDVNATVCTVAGYYSETWECVDRCDDCIDHIRLGRNRAETNGTATGDCRTTEVAIHFEDGRNIVVGNRERSVIGQVRTTSNWNLQLQRSVDLQGCSALHARLSVQSNCWCIRYRDRVFRGTAQDHIAIAHMLRRESKIGSSNRCREGFADSRLCARRCDWDGDIACNNICISGEFESTCGDRGPDGACDRNRLSVLQRSRHANNLQFRTYHVNSTRLGKGQVNHVSIDDRRLQSKGRTRDRFLQLDRNI